VCITPHQIDASRPDVALKGKHFSMLRDKYSTASQKVSVHGYWHNLGITLHTPDVFCIQVIHKPSQTGDRHKKTRQRRVSYAPELTD